MDHDEAVKQMAVERYLLNELTPELRDSFEEHAFDCAECSLDLKSGAAFIEAAKVELPHLVGSSSVASKSVPAQPAATKKSPLFWLRPAFAIPAFAALLAVVSYQNLATIPSLRNAAVEPRVLPAAAFHAGTRGTAHIPVEADRTQGVVLSIELPQDVSYTAYAFTLFDPQGKQLWTRTVNSSKAGSASDGIVSLVIPGAGLAPGSCTLAIAGTEVKGTRTEIDRRILDVNFDD